jgi:hypothetical protein
MDGWGGLLSILSISIPREHSKDRGVSCLVGSSVKGYMLQKQWHANRDYRMAKRNWHFWESCRNFSESVIEE